MNTAEIALLISLVSLSFSVWTAIANRRATQFGRLSELRSKANQLVWQMDYRLQDVRDAAQKLGLLDEGAAGNWKVNITRLEAILEQARQRQDFFKSVYESRKYVPLALSESIIEEWHHEVDRIAASVDISRKELIPALKDAAEKFGSLLLQEKRITEGCQITND